MLIVHQFKIANEVTTKPLSNRKGVNKYLMLLTENYIDFFVGRLLNLEARAQYANNR